MENTEVVDLLKLLDRKAIKRLHHIINMPRRNPTRVTLLFNFLYDSHPKFNDSRMTPSNAFKAVYEDREYDAKLLAKTSNDLKSEIEKFIAADYSSNDPFLQKMALAMFYTSKNRYDRLEKLNSLNHYDEDKFLLDYIIERQKHVLRTLSIPNSPLYKSLDFPKVMGALDYCYFFTRSYYSFVMRNHKVSLSEDKNLLSFEEYLSKADLGENEDKINMLSSIIELQNFVDEKIGIDELKNVIRPIMQFIPPIDLGDYVSLIMINIIHNPKISITEKSYRIAELIQFLQNQNVLTTLGYHDTLFINIISICLMLNDADWLDKKTINLYKEADDGHYELLMAVKYFINKDYDTIPALLTTSKKKIGNINENNPKHYSKAIRHYIELSLAYKTQTFQEFTNARDAFHAHLKLHFTKGDLAIKRAEAYRYFIYRVNDLQNFHKNFDIFDISEDAGDFFSEKGMEFGEDWLQKEIEDIIDIKSERNCLIKYRQKLKDQWEESNISSNKYHDCERKIEEIRKGFDENYGMANLNFMRLFQEVHQAQHEPYDSKYLSELESKICSTNPLIDRLWLLKKCNSIKTKNGIEI